MTLDDYLNRDVNKPAVPPPASEDKVSLVIPKSDYPTHISMDKAPDWDKMIKDKGYFGMFQAFNRKPDFDAEEKRLKRSRQLSVIGDLATLGGQMAASLMGARRFAPIQSDVPKYNDQLERLRNARMAYDAWYNDKSLSMIFRDYERKRAEEQYRSQMQAKAQKEAYDHAWEQYKFGKEQEHRDNTLKANSAAKSSTLTETKRHNQAMEGISRTNAATNAEQRNRVVDSVIGSDGNIYTRNTRLSPNEAMQIVLSSGMSQEDLAPFIITERDYLGNVTKSKTDYNAAAAYLFQNGMVSVDTLTGMGFRLNGKPVTSPKSIAGFGNQGKKKIKGF